MLKFGGLDISQPSPKAFPSMGTVARVLDAVFVMSLGKKIKSKGKPSQKAGIDQILAGYPKC